MVGIHLTVEKRAKRMPGTTVETIKVPKLSSQQSNLGAIFFPCRVRDVERSYIWQLV